MEKNDGRKTICRRGYNFNRRMKRIRKKLDLTQKGFVGLLGCSKKTVERVTGLRNFGIYMNQLFYHRCVIFK